jgi:tRNA (guanine-N7-)-methyltransferase
MSRRALRHLDPSLDLSRHLLVLEELPQPLDPAALFDRVAPVEIEVGSGKGLFLSTTAAADGECDFLGVEILAKYARFTAARLATQSLSNARMIHGDAGHLFRSWLSESSVRAVHVYFPDPWWKARHKKRRVMSADFLKHVQRVLLPGGVLHFWTDVEEYFQTSLELIASETRLDGPHPVAERPADQDLDYRTHFERRVRMHEEPVYRAEFRKRG